MLGAGDNSGTRLSARNFDSDEAQRHHAGTRARLPSDHAAKMCVRQCVKENSTCCTTESPAEVLAMHRARPRPRTLSNRRVFLRHRCVQLRYGVILGIDSLHVCTLPLHIHPQAHLQLAMVRILVQAGPVRIGLEYVQLAPSGSDCLLELAQSPLGVITQRSSFCTLTAARRVST